MHCDKRILIFDHLLNEIMMTDTKKSNYTWRYCKIGGVTRVKIDKGRDIANLGSLDQKLWTVLSCPVTGLEFDEKTLKLMDTNNDGKIRVNEVIAAAEWLTSVLNNPDLILKQSDSIKLEDFNQENESGKKLYDSAKQILKNLGLDKDEITLAEASDSVAIFAKTALNGDGVITEQSTKDDDLKDLIASAVSTVGGVDDRSGLKGINTELLDKFYAACSDYKAWKDAGVDDVFSYGDDTAASLEACNAIKTKVADYFMRCKLAAFHTDSASALDVSAARIGEISAKDLDSCNDEISSYPIARVNGKPVLPLDSSAINPAWQAAVAKVKALVLDKELPGAAEMTEEQWNAILAKFDAYTAWNDSKKGAEVESLGLDKINKILQEDRKKELADIIEKDKELEAESAAIDDVEKFLRYYKNFYKLLKNFVTLTDFYSRDPKNLPVFQVGTLYIDQRSTELCIQVADMGKQGEVSDLSGMYVLYCDCSSKALGKTMKIAAVLTDGDIDNIRVGKNAVFYDREGNDWDAVVTKILDNPISVRQAFWSPYRKLGRLISERIDKSAADRNAKVEADIVDKAKTTDIPTTNEAAAAAKEKPNVTGFDIAKFAGIFAALGLAIGFILDACTALVKGVMAHWYVAPILILIILILVSGPSMFIAWRKLRRRNLAPVLNANGWAINSHILVNIPFGKTFTSLAQYPKLDVEDPYEQKSAAGTILKAILWIAVITGLVLLGFYVTGHWNMVSDFFSSVVSHLHPAPAEVDPAAADAAAVDPAAVPAEAAPAPEAAPAK